MVLKTIYSCKYHYSDGVVVSIEPDRVDVDTKVVITCTRNRSFVWGIHLDANIYSDCGWESIIKNYLFKYGMKNQLDYISREFSLSLDDKTYLSSMHCTITDNGVALYRLGDSCIEKQIQVLCDFNNVLALKSIVESVFTIEYGKYQQMRL